MAKNLPGQASYELISGWLDDYRAASNTKKRIKIKTLIVAQMAPVVKHIARTIARRSTDPIEDMVQAGFIGLLKAIDTYSKEKNDNFKVYAGYFIIGEMKHYLRDKLSTIRVPGHIQELSVRINNFTKNLTPEELEDLTNDDVASALCVSPQTVDFAMQVERRRATVSLEELFSTEDDGLGYEELIASNDNNIDMAEARLIFEEILPKLSVEAKMLIDMYYYKDMSQKEIAEKLNLTPMSVSRRMKKTFSLIYKLLNDRAGELEKTGIID